MAQDSRSIPVEYPLRIIGTGRCGTTFMCREAQKAGLRIGHDKLGQDGVSGLAWCDPDPKRCKTDTLPLGSYRLTVHLVRHPLPCIASIAYTGMLVNFWEWIRQRLELPADPLLRAMRYWLEWNLRCEPLADSRIRIEDMGGKPMLARDHKAVSWNELYGADRQMASRIEQQATGYGY